MSPIIGSFSSGSAFGKRKTRFAAPLVSGGTKSILNDFILHTFTGTSNFIIDGANLLNVEVLLVGGGGGGGTRNAGGNAGGTDGGSGGGGGGFVQISGQTFNIGAYAASVGAGGAATTSPGNQSSGNVGVDTTIFGFTAKGGGYGGCGPGGNPGGPGGSGGAGGGGGGGGSPGGQAIQPTQPGLSGSSGFGNAGAGNPNQPPYTGSGGGGAGLNGTGVAGASGNAGHGGIGRGSTITGTTIIYSAGGGGGGGGPSTTNGGNGAFGPTGVLTGSGIVGHGGMSALNQSSTSGLSASNNTGHGGGGGCGVAPGFSGSGGFGGSGGSGIIIVKYPYVANNMSLSFNNGQSSANAAGSPLEISMAQGSTPSTGLYWIKNPGYNSNNAFQCLCDWSVYSKGIIILCGTGITDNSIRSWSEFGTESTTNSGTIGFRNNFYVPSATILSSWLGDSNNKFMLGMTSLDGNSIENSSNKRWYIIDEPPFVAKNMFDNQPGVGEFTGTVSSSSSGTIGTYYWSTSHGNQIYQMATSSNTVNNGLWMENRVGGSDGNHSPVVYGNNNGLYYVGNTPFTSRWMFMGFSPNNITSIS